MLSEIFRDEVKQMKTTDEVHEAWDVLKRKYNEIQGKLTYNFSIGDTVSFKGRGIAKTGKVTKVNQKTVSVLVGDFERWKCHPSGLTKVTV